MLWENALLSLLLQELRLWLVCPQATGIKRHLAEEVIRLTSQIKRCWEHWFGDP